MLKRISRFLASLELAVILIVFLAAVLAWATCLEAAKGRECAQWYVYGSQWFTALLVILGINILAATLVRFPWDRHQTGFVVTHAGLLVLLVGSIQTSLFGIEGQISLAEGERTDRIRVTDRSVITARRHAAQGGTSTELPLGFSIELEQFTRHRNPGRVGDASFTSSVRVVEGGEETGRRREISMSEPLTHGKFTFYQSSFQELPEGSYTSVLTVAHDPGRLLKYLGSFMVCVGMSIIFFMRVRKHQEASNA